MKRYVLIGCLAVLCLLFFILQRFPANQGMVLLARASDGMVMAYQATGTIWQGEAEHLYISSNNQLIDLGKTQWQLSPLSLLLAKLSLVLKTENQQQRIDAAITISPHVLSITQAEIRWPIAQLMRYVPLPIPLHVQGMLELSIAEAQITDTLQINALVGNVVLRDIALLMDKPIVFGSYAAKLSLEKETVIADVVDLDGTITLSGQSKINLAQRQYDSDFVFTPKANADAIIAQTLPMIARQQTNGSFVFKEKGSF